MKHFWNRTPLRGVQLLAVLMAMVSALLLVGCSGSGDASSEAKQLDPPAQALQSLLELRVERSADASAYAEYLLDPGVAHDLAASDAEAVDSTMSPIPQWEEPYVSDSEESSASVVVVWVPDMKYAEWPVASVFLMQDTEGAWKAGDANVVFEGEEIPPPEE